MGLMNGSSCVQLRNGPPKTLLQQQSVGVQFHDKPKSGSGSFTDVKMSEPVPEEDCDTQYARRVQAKMDAAKYSHSQRGCAFYSDSVAKHSSQQPCPCSSLQSLFLFILLTLPSVYTSPICLHLHVCGGCRGVKQARGQAYIKISEEEIADDYPMPKQYEMQDQEVDEFIVVGDEEMMLDVDPECLPKMVHFTFYFTTPCNHIIFCMLGGTTQCPSSCCCYLPHSQIAILSLQCA